MKKMVTLGFALSRSLGLERVSNAAKLCAQRQTSQKSVTRRRARQQQLSMAQPVEQERDPGIVAGTNLRIIRYPHPLLRAPNAEVASEEFSQDIRRIAKEMLQIMYASQGVGLAAPQVGVNKRLMVFNAEGDPKAWVHETILINPKIVASSKASDVEPEACLSFPEMSGKVRRREWVRVEAYKPNGKKFKIKYEGWKARVFQHEYDHLDGVLYIDRLDDEERKTVQPRLDELVAEYRRFPYEGKEPAL